MQMTTILHNTKLLSKVIGAILLDFNCIISSPALTSMLHTPAICVFIMRTFIKIYAYLLRVVPEVKVIQVSS